MSWIGNSNLKQGLFNFVTVTIPALIGVFMVLELVVFRFIIPASNHIPQIYDLDYHIMKNEPNVRGVNKAMDYEARFSINNHGWNSPHNYVEERTTGKVRIAVIGDSFVEAFQVDVERSFPYVLERELIEQGYDVEVYSFGFSGVPLSQYLQMMRYVCKVFAPDILVVNIVHNDFHESLNGVRGNPHLLTYAQDDDGTFFEIQPTPYHPDAKRRLLGKSAIVRFLYFDVNFQQFTSNLFRKPEDSMALEANIRLDEIKDWEQLDALTHHIFAEYQRLAQACGARLLLVMDTPRQFIYAGQDPKQSTIHKLNKFACQNADGLDIPFIDMTNTFVADYAAHHHRFEFERNGHWNAYAHQLVGETIADFITQSGWLVVNGQGP
jgi:lysophospholipase L1-like esterase